MHTTEEFYLSKGILREIWDSVTLKLRCFMHTGPAAFSAGLTCIRHIIQSKLSALPSWSC